MNDISTISLEGLKGWGGWSLTSLVVIWWIRGYAERKKATTEGETALRASYGEHIDRLTARIDKMEREHASDRTSWMTERTALRDEYEADRKRWSTELAQERKMREAERDQWRRERTELLDQVAGLERKLKSYGSSVSHLAESGVNAPSTVARLMIVHPEEGETK